MSHALCILHSSLCTHHFVLSTQRLQAEDAHLLHMAQPLCAVRPDEEEVFDAHTAPAGQVDAWLHGDDVAGLDDILALRPQGGFFVYRQAHAMPQRMDELVAKAGLLDDIARQPIGFCAR